MKKKSRVICCILAFLILIQSQNVYAAQSEFPSGISYDQLENEIEQYVDEHEQTTAGMAVAVFDTSEELLKKYYGFTDVENKIPVNEESVFEWGSATKLLVWVSVMQLYEQGRIDLNEDICTYLPEGFMKNLSYDTPVTMINLMNHDAGFQEDYVDVFVKDADVFENLEEALKAHEPKQIYEPGTVTAYSNWGVALAGYIVEQVSGLKFSEYVHRYIFEPLGMEHSAVSADLSDNVWVQEKRKELQCYTTEGELIPDCFYYITLYPAGMCTSTLNDFETFARALLDENTILFQKPETWQQLFTPTAYFGESEIPLNYHGFWMVPFGVQTIGHGGNTAGCSSYLLLDIENGIGAVVMTNQAYETVYNTEMMELIFGQYDRSDYTEENEIPSGIYRIARTVRKGPFKFLSLSYSIDEVDEQELWIAENESGLQKIVYSYGDYVKVPTYTFIGEMSLFILWTIAILFSMVSLVIRAMGKVIQNVKKESRRKTELSRWSAIAAVLQLAAFVMLIMIIGNVSNYSLGNTYAWMFAVIGIIAIVMCIMCWYGLKKNRKAELKTYQKVFHYVTIACMMITIVNIVYWDLFMFWGV